MRKRRPPWYFTAIMRYWSPRLISNWMDTGDAFAFLDRILEALGVIAQPFTATTSLPTLTPR